MFIPATCCQINRTFKIPFTTTCNDIDYTTCSIGAILRSTRAFDNLDFINSIHIRYFININACRLRPFFRAITQTARCNIIDTATIDEYYNAGITIDGHTIVIELVAILATTVTRVLECNAWYAFNRFCYITIMTFFNFFTGNNLYVTACTIIGLLSNRITILILRRVCSNIDIMYFIPFEILIIRIRLICA